MSYTQPPPAPTTPQPDNSMRTLLIILGSLGFVGVCMLLCTAIGIIGVLSILGERTSAVFEEIERDLNNDSQFVLPTTQPIDVGAAVPVGTTQRVGDLEINVTGARLILDAENQPADEYTRHLAVKVEIANRGTQPVALENTIPLTWLQDNDDFTYDCCVFSLTAPALLTEALPAGSSVTGEIVYEIYDDVDTFYWVYVDDISNTKMVVRLQQLSSNTNIARTRR